MIRWIRQNDSQKQIYMTINVVFPSMPMYKYAEFSSTEVICCFIVYRVFLSQREFGVAREETRRRSGDALNESRSLNGKREKRANNWDSDTCVQSVFRAVEKLASANQTDSW